MHIFNSISNFFIEGMLLLKSPFYCFLFLIGLYQNISH